MFPQNPLSPASQGFSPGGKVVRPRGDCRRRSARGVGGKPDGVKEGDLCRVFFHAGQLPHPGLQGEPDGLGVPVPGIQGHFDFAQKDVATQAFAVPHGQAQHATPELGLRDGVLGTGSAL